MSKWHLTEPEKTRGESDLGMGIDQGLKIGCVKVEMPMGHEGGNE